MYIKQTVHTQIIMDLCHSLKNYTSRPMGTSRQNVFRIVIHSFGMPQRQWITGCSLNCGCTLRCCVKLSYTCVYSSLTYNLELSTAPFHSHHLSVHNRREGTGVASTQVGYVLKTKYISFV